MTPEEAHNTPRWVKVFGIIAAALVVLVVVMMFVGGGRHGPGRHMLTSNAGDDTPLANVTEDATPPGGRLVGHTPPAGGH